MGSRGTGLRLGRTWIALLATQVALSLAILPSAMEMTWGIFRPSLLGPGFAVEDFLSTQIAMAGDASRFSKVQAELVRQLQAAPGVSGVTVSAAAPMEEPEGYIEVDGGAPAERVAFNRVDDVFFDMLGVRFLAGRTFGAGDFQLGRTAVIVNRSFVQDVFGGGNPLGRRIRYGRANDPDAASEARTWYQVVGIVEDFPANNIGATMYHPLVPGQSHPVSLVVHVGSNGPLVAVRLREIASAQDPALYLGRLRSLEDIYRQHMSVGRMIGLLLASVILIVLLFSMAGMYTLMAFTVAQRWREIGLRSALGAQPFVLVAGIFGRALLPVVAGAVVGCLLALLIDSKISQVLGWNIPGILPACATLMIAVGLLALIGPARRALRVDPAVALRES